MFSWKISCKSISPQINNEKNLRIVISATFFPKRPLGGPSAQWRVLKISSFKKNRHIQYEFLQIVLPQILFFLVLVFWLSRSCPLTWHFFCAFKSTRLPHAKFTSWRSILRKNNHFGYDLFDKLWSSPFFFFLFFFMLTYGGHGAAL